MITLSFTFALILLPTTSEGGCGSAPLRLNALNANWGEDSAET